MEMCVFFYFFILSLTYFSLLLKYATQKFCYANSKNNVTPQACQNRILSNKYVQVSNDLKVILQDYSTNHLQYIRGKSNVPLNICKKKKCFHWTHYPLWSIIQNKPVNFTACFPTMLKKLIMASGN